MATKIILTGHAAQSRWGFEGRLVLDNNDISWSPKDQDQNTMIRRAHFLASKISDSKHSIPAKGLALLLHFGQYRKYHNPPQEYIVHPIRVAERTTKFVGNYKHGKELVDAAYLHDVCEDCGVDDSLIRSYFGDLTADFVDDLTNKFKDATDETGKLYPRDKRKSLEFERIKTVQNPSKWVKMIDRIDNLSDMTYSQCGNFLTKYLGEAEQLLAVVKDSSEELAKELADVIAKKYSER